MKKNKLSFFYIVLLQIGVIIYTIAGIVGKFASAKEIFSFDFIFLYGVEILILGIYAILWQQLISRIDLSVAYVNRALSLLWSSLWAILIFKETLTFANVLGIIVVTLGILLVNSDESRKEEPHES